MKKIQSILILLVIVTTVSAQIQQPNFKQESPNLIDLTHLRMPDLVPKQGWNGTNPSGNRVMVNAQYISLNGKPWIMVAGEMHPVRYPAEQWEEQILKMKAGGLNTVSAYIFWSSHEEEESSFVWSGNRNIRHFVELCSKHGMFVFLRIGPYCNGEFIYGGLPPFLKEKGVKFRTNDPVYLEYVRRLYNQIGQQMEGLMFKDGGPIVAVQFENEFEHAPSSWGFTGEGGEQHMLNLKRMAIEAGLVAPMYVCTAWGGAPVPHDEMIPGQGGYPFMGQGNPSAYYTFYDAATRKHSNYEALRYPIANIEVGPGMLNVGKWRPVAPPEHAEALALIMTGIGGNILGYYMYQAGTHFIGKKGNSSVWGPQSSLSYDWHCPLREFGNSRPVFDYMKPVNFFLSDFGDLLAPMVTEIPAKGAINKNDTTSLRYAARAKGESGFLFLNNYQDRLQLPDRNNVSVDLKFNNFSMRIPQQGGFTLKHNQSAILPFNLDMDGVRLKYAMAQLYTRTTSADGRNVYVFFVPDGFDGSYVFDSNTLGKVSSTTANVEKNSSGTIVKTVPGTSSLINIKSKSGKKFQIMTLTRKQALTLTRQEIFGRQRIVLSNNMTISADNKLRVSQIGESNLGFSVFPAPEQKLVAEAGKLIASDDGVFRRYSIKLPEVKPAISINGIGSAEVKISAKSSVLDCCNDIFLYVDYLGDKAELKHEGELLCDDLYDRTGWQIGLKRFRNKLSGESLVMTVTPQQPIVEIVNNMEVNAEVIQKKDTKGDLLVGSYDGTSAKVAEQGRINSISVLPEYAVWVSGKNER